MRHASNEIYLFDSMDKDIEKCYKDDFAQYIRTTPKYKKIRKERQEKMRLEASQDDGMPLTFMELVNG